jgi:hypothetical protein
VVVGVPPRGSPPSVLVITVLVSAGASASLTVCARRQLPERHGSAPTDVGYKHGPGIRGRSRENPIDPRRIAVLVVRLSAVRPTASLRASCGGVVEGQPF